MRLTRADKLFYWLYWFSGHSGGAIPYDWVRDWQWYLRCREKGLTPWQAFTARSA